MADAIARYGLLGYFLLYISLAFAWRSFVVYRLTGVNPIVLASGDDAGSYVARAFKVVIAATAAAAAMPALAAVVPFVRASLGALPWVPEIAALFGWVLLIVSVILLIVAQVQMGASWRVGIDTAQQTELVRQGLFAWSRNPIFLSMRTTLLGFFLVLPCALTLAILAAGEILMQVQVRLEEQHLAALHGEAYRAYCADVRRWL